MFVAISFALGIVLGGGHAPAAAAPVHATASTQSSSRVSSGGGIGAKAISATSGGGIGAKAISASSGGGVGALKGVILGSGGGIGALLGIHP